MKRKAVTKAGFRGLLSEFLNRQLGLDLAARGAGSQVRAMRRRQVPHHMPPAATREHARPPRGTIDLGFWHLLKARRARGDPQRRRVYLWQGEVLKHLQPEPLLGEGANRRLTQANGRTAALGYLAHLWASYAKDFQPYYPGVPYLRVGFATALKRRLRGRAIHMAHAVPQRHSIYCRVESLNRSTLLHEVCHLLVWGDGHGPDFCAALLLLWEREFAVDRTHALTLARRLDVQVASLPT